MKQNDSEGLVEVNSRIDLGIAGKRVLVTGGSRGIGRATAILLARAGADVGIGYHSRHADAEHVVSAVRSLGVGGLAVRGDLTEPAAAEELFNRIKAELGGLDIVVANAAVWTAADVAIAAMADDQWRRTIEVNLTAMFHTVRLAARMISNGGRIVLVSSTAGQRGEAFHADYAASKGAVISLTKSVAIELAPREVTVNCIAPGWVDTDMVAKPFAGDGRRRIEAGIPLGRVACVDDIAGPIAFLCSKLARHITGEVLNINGGSVLCG